MLAKITMFFTRARLPLLRYSVSFCLYAYRLHKPERLNLARLRCVSLRLGTCESTCHVGKGNSAVPFVYFPSHVAPSYALPVLTEASGGVETGRLMDRVFEKSESPSAGGTKLKRLLLGKQRRPQQEDRQYFPYGGGGDLGDEIASQFNSYEPEELMVDSRVPIESSSLHVLKRNARKIFVSSSKYDVPDNLVPPNSRNASYDLPTRVSMPEVPGLAPSPPGLPLPSFDGLALSTMPKTVTQAVDYIRKLARASFVLRPLDSLADLSEDAGASIAVAAVEAWLLTLVLYTAAQMAQVLCTPSVWLLRLCFYVVK